MGDYLSCSRTILWGECVHSCVLGSQFQQVFLIALVAGLCDFPSFHFRDKNMKFTHTLLMISFKRKRMNEHVTEYQGMKIFRDICFEFTTCQVS